jgi:hypothetical protein
MKTAKLGAIFLISTIALAGVGAAYSWWQEDLIITGEVTMGTFGWEWSPVEYYFSHDYKNIITGDVWLTDTHEPGTPGAGTYDKLNIVADDVYPCTDISIWTDIHFWGSVPGHIYDVEYHLYVNGDEIYEIPQWMYVRVQVTDGTQDVLDDMGIVVGQDMSICEFFDRLTPTQWHYCYYLDLYIYIHWIQWDMEFIDPFGNQVGPFLGETFDVPMDAKLTFDITINGCQYNDPTYGGPIV